MSWRRFTPAQLTTAEIQESSWPTERRSTINPAPELTPLLKKLRLSGLVATLDERNRKAIDRKLAYTEFLTLLVQDEVARRAQKKFELRLRRAGFRPSKTLESFDFDFNQKVPRELIQDLATCRVLIVGPCCARWLLPASQRTGRPRLSPDCDTPAHPGLAEVGLPQLPPVGPCGRTPALDSERMLARPTLAHEVGQRLVVPYA